MSATSPLRTVTYWHALSAADTRDEPPDRGGPLAPQDELPSSDLRLIDAFADHLGLERRLSPNSVAAYRRDLVLLGGFLHRGGWSLSDAEHSTLRRFLAQQHARGYARATIARRVGAIRTFYRWALSRGEVPRDPSALLGRP